MAHVDRMPFKAGNGSFPAFYADPRLLEFARHAAFGVRRSNNLRFSANANAVPLMLSEFAAAMRFYPLVFIGDDAPVPMAILGVQDGCNLFVDGLGLWRRDHYIPACLLRYPFISVAGADGQQHLWADFASGRIVRLSDPADPTVERLFTPDGAPTAHARSIIDLCQKWDRNEHQTRGFGEALRAAGVLAERTIDLQDATGVVSTLGGFSTIDEAAFRALSPATLGEFAARGWLEPIVMHMVSQQNWRSIAQSYARALRRQTQWAA